MEEKFKKKRKKILLLLLAIVLIGVFIYNIFILIDWFKDHNQNLEEKKEIEKIIKVAEIEDSPTTEIINPPEEQDSDYFDYIKLPLTNIDFSQLTKINNDTVGFLSVPGTNINYPVVQTKDNDYYINHSFKKIENKAGWIFMDYRNNPIHLDKNTIFYGHGRLDSTMFGTLKNVLNSSWTKDKQNHIIRYSSKGQNMLFRVFSVYTIPTETKYIQTQFKSGEYKSWIEMMVKRSKYNFNTNVDENDIVITLSTCTGVNNKDRIVMHARLIKKDISF